MLQIQVLIVPSNTSLFRPCEAVCSLNPANNFMKAIADFLFSKFSVGNTRMVINQQTTTKV